MKINKTAKVIIGVVILISIIILVIICFSIKNNRVINKKYKAEKFDIIVQAGQSNSQGYGIGTTPEEYIENLNIMYLNPNYKILIAKEAVEKRQKINNFALSFAASYVENGLLAEGRKLLIIRTAVGGTGFSDCRWNLTGDLYKQMLDLTKKALALNSENRLVAFLWHQGETDAINNISEETHYTNLLTLVNNLRTKLESPRLPFIAGDFVQEWKNKDITTREPIVKAIRQVCSDIEFSGFVETDELMSNNQDTQNGDDIHFSRHALVILGKRYFEKYIKIISVA